MKQLPLPPKTIDVTGYFLGVYLGDGQPVLFMLEGVLFLPIFSTEEKFLAGMTFGQVEQPYKIQMIDDGREFLDSVRRQVRIMVDPWPTDNGTTRFQEILPVESVN